MPRQARADHEARVRGEDGRVVARLQHHAEREVAQVVAREVLGGEGDGAGHAVQGGHHAQVRVCLVQRAVDLRNLVLKALVAHRHRGKVGAAVPGQAG